MLAYELNGVEIDCCPFCGGTWLDTGELEQISEMAGAPPGPLAQALHQARDGQKSRRRCPRCRRRLRLVMVGEKPPIELDRCPRGHGLWFDPGEMESLIAQYDQGEAGAVARFFAEMFHHQRHSDQKGQ